MLLNLHVKNLALVKEAEIEFGKGLNILTGETGAGKSIIIGSVNLALGAKTGSEVIGKHEENALVELTFESHDERCIGYLTEQAIDTNDGIITISRKIMPSRSVIKINGETVTASIVKKLTEYLIDIHGQHDHQSLLYKHKHLEIVDKYAKDDLLPLKTELKQVFSEYKEADKKLKEYNIDEEERNRNISFLTYEIAEIDNAAIREGEDEEIEAAYKKMANSQKIRVNMDEAMQLLSSSREMSAADAVSRACQLANASLQYDEDIKYISDMLSDLDSVMSDVIREISDYGNSLDFDEREFVETEKRMDLINNLKAKYGQSYEQICQYRAEAEEKLNFYSEYEERLLMLQNRVKEKYDRTKEICDKITAIRTEAANALAKEVENTLEDLNFEQVKFEVVIRALAEVTADGADEAEFMISVNPGEEIKPLAKIASGGELSRIMLGIKAVLARKDDTDTLIFDEIDTGISGRTAQKVSEKMALVAKNHQVLCITHLPQIAAMADTHFLIEKHVADNSTETEISELMQDEIINELSRMLGGSEITDVVNENAKQMKELANKYKTN